jgi:hypothetical protein
VQYGADDDLDVDEWLPNDSEMFERYHSVICRIQVPIVFVGVYSGGNFGGITKSSVF